jgi:hypothetical protein
MFSHYEPPFANFIHHVIVTTVPGCIQVLAATEQHKRGLAATDPITGALIGPLCISRLPLNDPKRKPMLALAHFSVGDLRRFNVILFNLGISLSLTHLAVAYLGIPTYT